MTVKTDVPCAPHIYTMHEIRPPLEGTTGYEKGTSFSQIRSDIYCDYSLGAVCELEALRLRLSDVDFSSNLLVIE